MKNLFTFLMLGLFVFLLSCNRDEEPEPDPIIGEWEMVGYEVVDVPTAFSAYEGQTGVSLYGESVYTIEFREDNTYERTLRFAGQRIEDEGEWEFDGEDLELDPDDPVQGLPIDLVLQGEIGDEMILRAAAVFTLLPNSVRDTAQIENYTDEQFNQLFNDYAQNVEVNVLYTFERE